MGENFYFYKQNQNFLGINSETNIFFSNNIMNIEANIWQQDR